jgi:hypothetical protein
MSAPPKLLGGSSTRSTSHEPSRTKTLLRVAPTLRDRTTPFEMSVAHEEGLSTSSDQFPITACADAVGEMSPVSVPSSPPGNSPAVATLFPAQ